MIKSVGGVILALLLLSACRTQQAGPPRITSQQLTPPSITVNKGAYLIKPGDRLRIRNLNWLTDLFPDPNLVKDTPAGGGNEGGFAVSVSSEGLISMPEIGRVRVEGLTRKQLTDTLSVLYRDVVRDPLFEVEITNLRVKVLGAVNNQGLIPLEKEYQSLGDVLAKAGGIRYAEAGNTIQIIRGEGTEQQVVQYDFQQLGNPLIVNQYIYDNDIVYVPPSTESLRTVRNQRTLILVQPMLAALNLTVLIINLLTR
ncbi:polysaccharide biosynthesis/export family protein [Telluribacter humicola]|uniref:polysaccharide biosynthesis/export family protein n=1 Tax=Telluribacter humicola TaxID=1720261 RepID=UPI001A972C24|nr:polysaccharide biosynthesis/export family protein [Telluribacter humicola]